MLSVIAFAAVLPACGELLGAEFDDVGEDCKMEGERRCGDDLVCRSGKWASDGDELFCTGGSVATCAGASMQVLDVCKGPCSAGVCRNVEELEVGLDTSCARLDDGSVWCWGDNFLGALGRDATIAWSSTPAPVSGVSGAIDVALGDGFGCALSTAGSVACWGRGGAGGIGAHGGTWSAVAVEIQPLGNVEALFAVRDTACARAKGGSMACWGRAEYPCMQAASDGWAAFFPVPVPELNTASSMFGAQDFLCGLTSNQQLACCHDGPSVWLSDAKKANDLAAGAGGKDHICVGSASGNVSCWGSNHRGQLCRPSRSNADELTTFSVKPLLQMDAGVATTYFLDTTGNVQCCGDNADSGCGRPSTSGGLFPAPVDVMSDVQSIKAGARHACALGIDREVRCWGLNVKGQCGTPESNLVSEPTPVVWQP